jgi:predicted nicotinamide N-methyase
MDFRSVGMDRIAVAGAVAVAVADAGAAVVAAADIAVDAAGAAAVAAVAVAVAVAEIVIPDALHDSRLEIVVDRNELTFFVSCRRMTRSD